MPVKRPPPRPLPRWLMVGASLFVALHLLALGALVLSAQSGPWPTPFGPSPALGPPFAQRVADVTTRYYLRPLQMTHTYHFLGNRPDQTDIRFEVRLKDANGRLMTQVLTFPPRHENPWLRRRHEQLAQGLGNDDQIPAPQGEEIAAPHQKAPTIKVWDSAGEPFHLVYREKEKHLLPKGQPIARPNEWALILAQSYARYLCREHGAAAAEVTRISRGPISPAVLFTEQPLPGTYDTLVSTFEEYRRDH